MTNIAYVNDARAHIAETIKIHPVVLFMKGSLSRPQCGFSAAVFQILAHYGVPVDVLLDPSVRQAIKTFSDCHIAGRATAETHFLRSAIAPQRGALRLLQPIHTDGRIFPVSLQDALRIQEPKEARPP
jgi:glutaredoxin-related protein